MCNVLMYVVVILLWLCVLCDDVSVFGTSVFGYDVVSDVANAFNLFVF